MVPVYVKLMLLDMEDLQSCNKLRAVKDCCHSMCGHLQSFFDGLFNIRASPSHISVALLICDFQEVRRVRTTIQFQCALATGWLHAAQMQPAH